MRMTHISKRPETTSGEGAARKQTLYSVGGNVEGPCHKNNMEAPQNTKNRSTIRSSNFIPKYELEKYKNTNSKG